MTWNDVGKFIGDSAPKLAGLLTNPVGTVVSMGTDLISRALGADDPDTAMEVLKKDPQALVKVREIEADLEKVKIQAESVEIDRAAQIIQTEGSSEDEYVRRTRPKIIRMSFYLSATLSVGGLIAMIVLGLTNEIEAGLFKILVSSWKELCIYYGGLTTAGFLGYVRYRSVHDKRLAQGMEPQGLIQQIAGVMKR